MVMIRAELPSSGDRWSGCECSQKESRQNVLMDQTKEWERKTGVKEGSKMFGMNNW